MFMSEIQPALPIQDMIRDKNEDKDIESDDSDDNKNAKGRGTA